MQNSKLSDSVQSRLRCPSCRSHLEVTSENALCASAQCGARYPIIDGVPILINEKTSVFSLEDFARGRNTTFILRRSKRDALLYHLIDLMPDISASVHGKRNYALLRDLLLRQTPSPRVLVLGGSILGQGIEPLAGSSSIEMIGTDVSFGPLTALICDAHDIPFEDATFDGVVAQAVLEHVVDPYRCAEEIHRVLKPDGFVYAETPFIQQVHMGRYDFTRFTHSGHRRLFRHFTEIASGPIGGPGMALAWSYQYFLLSFTTSRVLRGLVRAFTRLTSFYLKYVDYYLIDTTAAYDAASGFYFIGRKAGTAFSDRELVRYYRGALSN